MGDHYVDVLQSLVRKQWIHPDMRVLVLCGWMRDREALLEAGFKNVTLSNLDPRADGSECAPFAWSVQDAENIAFPDGSFDFCIVHDGLHHCASPHRGLLELYRVAKVGLLVFEPRDNWITRLGVALNFGQEYEVAAVFGSDWHGGVRNSEIPNYVFRWTEAEIKKTISSFVPWGRNRFLFFYQLRLPWERLRAQRNRLWFALMVLCAPFLKLFTWLFPGQSNTFAFAVFKPRIPEDLHPWIDHRGNELKINKAWVSEHYR